MFHQYPHPFLSYQGGRGGEDNTDVCNHQLTLWLAKLNDDIGSNHNNKFVSKGSMHRTNLLGGGFLYKGHQMLPTSPPHTCPSSHTDK